MVITYRPKSKMANIVVNSGTADQAKLQGRGATTIELLHQYTNFAHRLVG
jgi:hypothetical protein